jgi:2-hydroxychromene-2-carboxylate isomerase
MAGAATKFYFCLRSPYTWLAVHDLRVRYPDLDGRVEWIPSWEPDEVVLRMLVEAGGRFGYTGMSPAKDRYIRQDVDRLARERGLTFTWPVDRSPWWEVPHLAYLAARRHGRGTEFVEAALRVRWEDGRDICDPAVIARLGTVIGLDPVRLRTADSDPALLAEGVQALLATERDGVFGVPFFLHGTETYWGVERLAAFAEAVRSSRVPVWAAPEPAAESLGGNGFEPLVIDGGHPGGCG